jgi:hypothetical protein
MYMRDNAKKNDHSWLFHKIKRINNGVHIRQDIIYLWSQYEKRILYLLFFVWLIGKNNLTHTDSIFGKYIQLKVDNCVLNDKHEKRFSFFQTIEIWRNVEGKIKCSLMKAIYGNRRLRNLSFRLMGCFATTWRPTKPIISLPLIDIQIH